MKRQFNVLTVSRKTFAASINKLAPYLSNYPYQVTSRADCFFLETSVDVSVPRMIMSGN